MYHKPRLVYPGPCLTISSYYQFPDSVLLYVLCMQIFHLECIWNAFWKLYCPVNFFGCTHKIGQTHGLVSFGRWIHPIL